MSAFLKFKAQQTSFIVMVCTTKILLLPRFLKFRFPPKHPCLLDRDVFRSKYARRVRPDRSVSMHSRWRHWGKGMHLLPLQRHTPKTSLSTRLPMPVRWPNTIILYGSIIFWIRDATLSSYQQHHHHHQNVLPKSRSFTANAGTKAVYLPKAGLPPQTWSQGSSFTRDE